MRYLALIALLPGALFAQALPEGGTDDLAILGQTINWGGVTTSIAVIVLAWLAIKFVDNLVEELGKAFAERRLLFQRANAFFHFFIYLIVAVCIVLFSFEFSEQVLAIIGGGVVVAIGFATRDLLASLAAGVMIVFDRPFQVGDRVSFAGQYGDVIQIGLRSVKLRTLDDSVVTIPNNLFLSEVSSSANFGVLDMQIDTDFFIGVDQDAALARDLVREAAAISLYIYLPKSLAVNVEQVRLDSLVALRIRLKAYVLDTLYEKRFVTDVTLRVQEAFAANGIQAPALLHRNPD
jgi:small-conductance mechanosensitive channel